MESYVALKNSGIKRMNTKKYKDAICDFTQVIDKLESPSKDDEAVLKAVCYLNRSSCYIFQDDFDHSISDANSVIELYKSMRTEEQQKALTPEQMRKDPLTGVLSLAYIRRGEAFESQLQFLDAFHEYAASNMLVPEGESQKAMRSLLKKLNVPDINMKDKDLQPFAVLLLQFVNEASLTVALTNLVEHLSTKKAEISQQIYSKYDSAKCANILYALMQLYSDSEFIVICCITAIRLLAEAGIGSNVWNGFLIIREVMIRWKGNENICGESINFLYLAPPELFKYMIQYDFITPVVDSFKIKDIKAEEIEKAFFILYQIACSPSHIENIIEAGIIDHIIIQKSIGALMLLSKISVDSEVVIQTHSNGELNWVLKLVRENQENQEVIIAAAIITTRMLLADGEENHPCKEELSEMFDLFSPLIIKNSKNCEVVSAVFAAFAIAATVCPSKITEHNLIRAASAILAIHMKNTTVAQNIVTFFYECSVNGLLNEILETKPVIPTVMKALQEHPKYQSLVERTAALAVLCNIPNKDQLFSAAVEQFPHSSFLARFQMKNKQAQ